MDAFIWILGELSVVMLLIILVFSILGFGILIILDIILHIKNPKLLTPCWVHEYETIEKANQWGYRKYLQCIKCGKIKDK